MDNVIVGSTYGRVKAMIDHTGKKLKEVGPSGVARLAGLNETPKSGDILQVVGSDKEARLQAIKIKELLKNQEYLKLGLGVTDIMSLIQQGKLKTLKLIIKADTKGSLEAIRQALAEIKSDDVAIKVVHSGVGSVTEGDVMMASAGAGIVVGFHVDAGAHVKKMAERENVEVVLYKVIYELIDDVKKLLTGMLEPEIVVTELGKLELKGIFFTGKKDMIVGGKVIEGKLEKDADLRVFRDEEQIGEGKMTELKVVKEDVKEVEEGQECGIKYEGAVKLQEGDVLEAFKEEKRIKTLG